MGPGRGLPGLTWTRISRLAELPPALSCYLYTLI